MNAALEHVGCAICRQVAADSFITREDGETRIVRCRNDGLLYLSPRPSREQIARLFAQCVSDDSQQMFSARRSAVLRREARAVQQAKSGGALLDIGCATGEFLSFFDGRRWCLHGVETSPSGAETARRRAGAEVFCGTLHGAAYPSAHFDVVSILDTLYYVPDPRSELSEIRRVLKDDGLLAIEIPGINYRLYFRDRGPMCWILDRRWSRLAEVNSHLYYFSPATLSRLLEDVGFRVLRVVPEQASLGHGRIARVVNDLHFAAARAVFGGTGGRVSVAAKELYLAAKA